jgi:putative transcriptional regulator
VYVKLTLHKKAFGMKNNVERFRKNQNYTQEDLADKLGVSRQTINSLEKGKYNPSIQLAFKLAMLFDVTIETLFIYEEEENGKES